MNFLIVKTSAIGDIIHSFPVLEYLHKKFPGCRVDWVVEKRYVDLAASHPLVNKVFTIDSYSWRKGWYKISTWKEIFAFRYTLKHSSYEAVFDLQGNTKSSLATKWAKSKAKVGFGWGSAAEKPNLLVTNHRFEVPSYLNIQTRYLTLVQSYFHDHDFFTHQGIFLNVPKEKEFSGFSDKMKLMVAFGSKWENKMLSYETLSHFLQKIDQAYPSYFFFVWGSEREKKTADKLTELFPQRSQVIGKLDFARWQALMRQMDCVIAMDSAALHLCGTTNTPSFSVFGPSSASIYKPLGKQHVAVQGSCPYGENFVQRCKLLRTCSTGACMKSLTADALFQRFTPIAIALNKP